MWDSIVYMVLAQECLRCLKEEALLKDSETMGQLRGCLQNDAWGTLFVLGCMLPNAVCNDVPEKQRIECYNQLHFRNSFSLSREYSEHIHADIFLGRYGACIYRPMELGFYFHLLIDDRKKFFDKSNFRILNLSGKEGKIVQYIPKISFRYRPVFEQEKLPLEFMIREYAGGNILEELEKIRTWINKKENSIESIIDEVDRFEIRCVLEKEIKLCCDTVKKIRLESQNNSLFIEHLQRDIQDHFELCCREFSSFLVNNIDRYGWAKASQMKRIKSWILDQGYTAAACIRQKGIIKIIFTSSGKVTEKIRIFILGKKKQHINIQNEILKEWKKQWIQDPLYSEQYDLFYPLFLDLYGFLAKKISKNRKRNWQMKILFLLIPFLSVLVCFLSIASTIFSENPLEVWTSVLNAENLLILGAGTTIGIFLSAIVSKWIDIKKYQETWIRHSNHKYKLDKEIFLFINSIGEYQSCNKKMIFIKNIWKIEDENEEKFVKNMEEKEHTLVDLFQYLKK